MWRKEIFSLQKIKVLALAEMKSAINGRQSKNIKPNGKMLN